MALTPFRVALLKTLLIEAVAERQVVTDSNVHAGLVQIEAGWIDLRENLARRDRKMQDRVWDRSGSTEHFEPVVVNVAR